MCNKINNEINNLISRFNETDNIKSPLKDLTYLKTYTIDDTNTIEIDDAISLENISFRFKFHKTFLIRI